MKKWENLRIRPPKDPRHRQAEVAVDCGDKTVTDHGDLSSIKGRKDVAQRLATRLRELGCRKKGEKLAAELAAEL
jgi:hypothetical protein